MFKRKSKTPVVDKIFKQLTPERIKQEVEAIQNVELPEELQKWVDEYNKVGDRDPFIWKCVYKFASYGTLPCVMEKYQESAYEIKIIGMLFVALADDLADKYRNKELLDEILRIPFNQNFQIPKSFSLDHQQYLQSAQKIWGFLQQSIRRCPYYNNYEKLFEFDYNQVFNSLKYGYLVSQNIHLLNMEESYAYLPYNMQVFVNATIDLMCIKTFDITESRGLREIIRNVQIMARISNCLGTWERELGDNDFSSLIFVHALQNDIITLEELQEKNEKAIKEKISYSNCEGYLFSEWEKYYKKAEILGRNIHSVDIPQYLKGFEEVLKMYIINQKIYKNGFNFNK